MLYTVHAPEGVEYPEQPQDARTTRSRASTRRAGTVTDYVEGQDIMAWVTQGAITDRTVEHLGRSDVGVTMLRKMFKEQMAQGRARRGPARASSARQHDRIDLPCEKDKFDAGPAFALDFIEMGLVRFSPQADTLKKLHIKAWENRGEPVC